MKECSDQAFINSCIRERKIHTREKDKRTWDGSLILWNNKLSFIQVHTRVRDTTESYDYKKAWRFPSHVIQQNHWLKVSLTCDNDALTVESVTYKVSLYVTWGEKRACLFAWHVIMMLSLSSPWHAPILRSVKKQGRDKFRPRQRKQ